MAVTKKIRSVSLRHCSLSCHELARPAYALSKDLRHQISNRQLPQEFITLSQTLEPVHVIEAPNNSFEFFAGWQWLDECKIRQVQDISIIIHKHIPSGEIVKTAWAYQLCKHSSDLHRSSNLAQLTELLDKIPSNIKKQLLNGSYSSSALKTFSNLTNESRSAIRNQLRKTKITRTETKHKSVLSELLRSN